MSHLEWKQCDWMVAGHPADAVVCTAVHGLDHVSPWVRSVWLNDRWSPRRRSGMHCSRWFGPGICLTLSESRVTEWSLATPQTQWPTLVDTPMGGTYSRSTSIFCIFIYFFIFILFLFYFLFVLMLLLFHHFFSLTLLVKCWDSRPWRDAILDVLPHIFANILI